jgi:hypothetical protein
VTSGVANGVRLPVSGASQGTSFGFFGSGALPPWSAKSYETIRATAELATCCGAFVAATIVALIDWLQMLRMATALAFPTAPKAAACKHGWVSPSICSGSCGEPVVFTACIVSLAMARRNKCPTSWAMPVTLAMSGRFGVAAWQVPADIPHLTSITVIASNLGFSSHQNVDK